MFGWQEIYLTTNKESFDNAIKKLLSKNINYKTKTKSDQLRLSMNNMNGREPSLSRGGGTNNTYYYIYVKKENVDFVKSVLNLV